MRARLCTAAASSTTASMSCYSRPTAQGWRPVRRGFCDRTWPPESPGNGDAFVSGDAHLRSVSEENYRHRAGGQGDAWVPGALPDPPPDPGFRFPQPPQCFRYLPPPPGPRPQPPPPFYRSPTPRDSWRPWAPDFGPQHPPAYGPPPPNSWQPPPSRFSYQQSQHPPVYGPRNGWQPQPSHFRTQPPRPRPQPADYRSWVPSPLPPPPPECERFRVLSYNILADYLARDHRSKLYFHIPPELLDWEWRKRRLVIEFGLWSPDIMCLQEVDRFQDLEEELARHGYDGVWKMRTGNAVDGCAIFWRTHRFVLRHEEHIEFAKFGLRDNVAQICVLELRSQSPAVTGTAASSARSSPSTGIDRIVVCNVHVLYNPKRGEIKLGQVRILLDRAYTVSKTWNEAPVILCGDFNCTPKSPLYNFISEQKLNLSGLARNQISGQNSAAVYAPRLSTGSGLYRTSPHGNNGGKAASSELDSHKTGNNVENALSVGSFSSGHASEILGSCSQLKNEEETRSDAVPEGAEMDELGSLHVCKKKDSSKETMKDIIGPNEVMTNMESEGAVNLTSTSASSKEDLHTVVELQNDDKCGNDSSVIMGTENKQGEQVNGQHLVSLGNKEMLHCVLDSISGAKNISTMHTSCTFSTMQEDFMDAEMMKDTFNYCHNKQHVEDNKDEFSSSNDLETSLYSKSESDKFPNDVSVVTPLPESTEPSTGLISGQEKGDLGASCQNSYKSAPLGSSSMLDSNLDLEAIDSSVCELTGQKEHANFGSEQVVADAHEESPGATEDITSQSRIYYQSSFQYSGNAALSSGVDVGELQNLSANVGEITSESHSCLIDEEGNSDSTFLEELHGTNAGGTSLSSHSIFLSFHGSIGEEEVKSDMLNSNTSHQPQESSKLQEMIYDPLLWTPMEIQAASGNAECNLVEHNIKLKSAYTEVEDHAGTKDSNREPQVTSYNRQFMGTVDYIWHSEDLQTVQVLDTIPQHILRRTSGFPTKKWGSDHIALACEFAFKKS